MGMQQAMGHSFRMTKEYIFENYDKKDSNGLWMTSWSSNSGIKGHYIQHRSLSWRRWSDLVQRCKVDGFFQKRRPSYIGVENKFESFKLFADWSNNQKGYDVLDRDGKVFALEKDIKIYGSNEYSPETCLFAPRRVNNFILKSDERIGDFPLGVTFENGKRYRSRVKDDKILLELGRYECPMEAHRAWQKGKASIGYKLALEYSWHSELSEALIRYSDMLLDHSRNGVETK